MEAKIIDNILYMVRRSHDGKLKKQNLNSLVKLEDWQLLTDSLILFCNGMRENSTRKVISNIQMIMSGVIDQMEIGHLPSSHSQWTEFIKNCYAYCLVYPTSNKLARYSLKSRTRTWRYEFSPFLTYLQNRNYIPMTVIIPAMKMVGEKISENSFNINLIGDNEPRSVRLHDNIDKLIIPVSLSRSDSDYLDELYFDIERTRNKIKQCLVDYWNTIKCHYETGTQLIESVDRERVLKRIHDADFFDKRKCRGGGTRMHFASPVTKDRFATYLFIHKEFGHICSVKNRVNNLMIPSLVRCQQNIAWDVFPVHKIENIKLIKDIDRINWALGNLTLRDISYICALLIMLNPKFNYEALLYCDVVDKQGKPWLERASQGFSFCIEKPRAGSMKTEYLDELSYDIIKTLIEMNRGKEIESILRRRLFISISSNKESYVSPSSDRVSKWLSGFNSPNIPNDKSATTFIRDYFPSLAKYGIKINSITHAKIRNTEGVLEWFRTGSIRSASKVLGNSCKIALDHYIPKSLIAIYNTRQIRRFQNLLIVVSILNEDYILKAVDFNSLSDVNVFILDMLKINGKSNNPLMRYLRSEYEFENHQNDFSAKLIASISAGTLTALYTYHEAAVRSCVEAKTLSIKDSESKIAPIAFISLSKYFKDTLPHHSDNIVRSAHYDAVKASDEFSDSVNWQDLFIRRANVS